MLFAALFSLMIGGVTTGVILYAVLWLLERDRHVPFSTALGLAFGIRLASIVLALLLGAFFGPLVFVPICFAAWAILTRYGRLSEKHAVIAVAAMFVVELGLGALMA